MDDFIKVSFDDQTSKKADAEYDAWIGHCRLSSSTSRARVLTTCLAQPRINKWIATRSCNSPRSNLESTQLANPSRQFKQAAGALS